jgi:hypothetical protein
VREIFSPVQKSLLKMKMNGKSESTTTNEQTRPRLDYRNKLILAPMVRVTIG